MVCLRSEIIKIQTSYSLYWLFSYHQILKQVLKYEKLKGIRTTITHKRERKYDYKGIDWKDKIRLWCHAATESYSCYFEASTKHFYRLVILKEYKKKFHFIYSKQWKTQLSKCNSDTSCIHQIVYENSSFGAFGKRDKITFKLYRK